MAETLGGKNTGAWFKPYQALTTIRQAFGNRWTKWVTGKQVKTQCLRDQTGQEAETGPKQTKAHEEWKWSKWFERKSKQRWDSQWEWNLLEKYTDIFKHKCKFCMTYYRSIFSI